MSANASQRVVGLIGCPASGKSTMAASFLPSAGWTHLTLDDLRQALWPPHRQVYWQIRATGYDLAAQQVLHRLKEAALDLALAQGFSVVMADTHLTKPVFARELEIIARHGITVEWKLLDVPWDELVRRNRQRGLIDPAHRVTDEILAATYQALHAEDAWWRSLPSEQIEIIPCV
ncbi:AAA family ATPase [Methylorubrum extorquens]|uniref:Kinase n=1 Tax=Methylorubrum extorquens (strain CM4 / NCIMB 13688) TaxID=440085 RepID=B7L3J4_METC4|nr:AAA family ATPase [Methylorubrum extorquens]ACK86402.1 conserved hypothetical protein [Methylorubrum extorquens CM4]